MNTIKKGAADLIAIVVAVVVIGSLTFGIASTIGKKTTQAQDTNMEKATNLATSAILSD